MTFRTFIERGWPRELLIPISRGQKGPTVKGWTNGVLGEWREWDRHGFNVGVLCGVPDVFDGLAVYGVDVDAEDEDLAGGAVDLVKAMVDGPVGVRRRRLEPEDERNGRCMVVFRGALGLKLPTLRVAGGEIQWSGAGKQFVAAGVAPLGKDGPPRAYEWVGGVPRWGDLGIMEQK